MLFTNCATSGARSNLMYKAMKEYNEIDREGASIANDYQARQSYETLSRSLNNTQPISYNSKANGNATVKNLTLCLEIIPITWAELIDKWA
jgi:hypothetical protein